LATACGFGAVALVTAWVVLPAWRGRLLRVVLELVGAGVIAAAILSPYIYEAIIRHRPAVPAGIADNAVTDLASLVVPMVVDWVRYAPGVRSNFTANFAEQGGYLGVPLLIALGIAVWQLRRCQTMWIPLVAGLAALILSMGDRLQIDGHWTISLPWRLISDHFVFKSVTPDRMIVYVWLAVAVLTAIWLAQPGRRLWIRWALVCAAVVTLLPHPNSGLYDGPPDQPSLVSTSAYEHVLPHHGQVLILPYAAAGASMQWQADTNFWFRMPEGYLSIGVPKPFVINPASAALSHNPHPPISPGQLRAFLADFHVDAVLVDPSHAGTWPQQMQAVGLHGRLIDGVLLYPVRR
jgi:hypothetical protein